MEALIDGDVLRYEVGSVGQNPDEILSFDYVARVLDEKIEAILYNTEATDCTVYLTGKGNFREALAVSKPYKGNRPDNKPWHFQNLTAYLHNQYNVIVAEGMEADDLMSIRQYQRYINGKQDTVICTRDKDLRMIPGWHYGWECGGQREYFKRLVSEEGEMQYDPEKKKVTGTGMMFFYLQLLMGDSTDNIPGCPGIGPKKAFDVLFGTPVEDMFQKVREVYHSKGHSDDYLLEQGRLLWMTRELNDDGTPVLWQFPT